MMPIGRHTASGLSLLLRAIRFFRRSVAHGVIGKPSLMAPATLRNWATGGAPAGAAAGAIPRPPVDAPLQTPEKSGLPSAVRGAGAARSGSPLGSFGTPAAGITSHCAERDAARTPRVASTPAARITAFIRASDFSGRRPLPPHAR